jgi:molybdenum cofactor synthesis domain-containing protein
MGDIRMKGFPTTTSIDDVLNILLRKIKFSPKTETISIKKSLNRVISEDITSKIYSPAFNRSAMDGYGVRSENTSGASINNPIKFKIIGRIDAGHFTNIEINDFETIEIMTGAKVPSSADAVVMFEYSNKLNKNEVEIYQQVTPGLNIDKLGSDISRGQIVINKNKILKPADLGVIKALGIKKIRVYKRPKIALLSTGDELIDNTINENKGKIVENNQIILSSYIKEHGGIPISLGVVPDDGDKIKNSILKALNQYDMLFITGGTSVGKKDLVPGIIASLGEIIVHGVSMKPGKPTGLAIINDKPIILMPGYPVAAIISYLIFGRALINNFFNLDGKILENRIYAKLKKRIPSLPGRRDFVRVYLEEKNGQYYAYPIRASGSGILSSIVKADGLIEIPENLEGYEEGEILPIILLRNQILGYKK